MELKSTDITDLVVSSYGNYYWKAKINGLAREGSLDTKSILVTKSKLFRDLQAASQLSCMHCNSKGTLRKDWPDKGAPCPKCGTHLPQSVSYLIT